MRFFDKTDEDTFYNCLAACLVTAAVCFLCFTFIFLQTYKKNNEFTEQLLNTVVSYLANATDDEYDEIAQEIRHDLIYHTNTKQLIQYIPNTATDCPTCQSYYEYQVYFVANNTGELYSLDTERKLTGEQFSMRSGYDEISQTRLNMTYDRSCIVRIAQKQDTVSINRMKTIFCDDCIDKILAVIDGQNITSFVIFIPQEQAFYPICEDTKLQIDGGTLSITFDKEEQEIQVEYAR